MSRASRSLADNIHIAAFLAILLTTPLYLDTTRNRDWGDGLFILLTGALLASWAFRAAVGKQLSNPAWTPALPMIGLLVAVQTWVGLSIVMGTTVDFGSTAQSFLLGIAYTGFFILTIGLFRTRKRLTLLISALLISATLQAFYGTLMTLTGIEWQLVEEKTQYRGVATGTFYNRNHLAGYLEMMLGLGLGLMLAFKDNRRMSLRNLFELLMGPKARIRLALVIMVIALVMTRSRMGNTGFFVSLMVIGGLYTALNKENRLRNVLLLTSLIVIDVLVISQYFGLEKLKDRLINTRFEDQVVMQSTTDGQLEQRVLKANEVRDDLNEYSWPMFKERPWLGWGAGSFEAGFQKFPGPEIGKFDHAHNDYMEFAIEFGVIGFLPLLAFVLLALFNSLRALFNLESAYRSGIGFGASMAIIAIGIHSITDFNLQIPANAVTFIVVCAIAVLANTHIKTKDKK